MITSSEDRNVYKIFCDADDKNLEFLRGVVNERLGALSEMTFEFFVPLKISFNIEDVIGRKMTLETATFSGEDKAQYYRRFSGVVVEIEELDHIFGHRHFIAEVRPELWYLGKTEDNRIFQNMTAVDIITQVLRENKLTDIKLILSHSYAVREYCVQYNETDLDFIHRLMEEEGIYYMFDYPQDQGHREHIQLRDDNTRHQDIIHGKPLPIMLDEYQNEFQEVCLYDWTMIRRQTHGKITLQEYDFTKSTANMKVNKAILKGKSKHNGQEVYRYPGHYTETAVGKERARVKMESEAVKFAFRSALSTEQTVALGRIFQIRKSDIPPLIKETEDRFLVVNSTHYFQGNHDFNASEEEVEEHYVVVFPEGAVERYYAYIEFVPVNVPFRMPLETPWPNISGVQTALVVGPKGSEIYTDKFGRIKVQFHWDRLGKKNENSSCWIRVATPWAGKKWGMVSVPRIGQEAVIQFEEGNPDRPLCTGMVYNDQNMVPWDLPSNMTQTGVKTNSSKGGGGYNELMFEDKKGSELVRFQAEKDYNGLIKHDSDVNIKHDSNLKIDNNSTVKIGSNLTETIEKNQKTTISSGNLNIKASKGKIEIEAKQSIELKVGGSTIKITPFSIDIKSKMIKVTSQGMCQIKSGGMLQAKGSIVVVKGNMTMIN